MGSSQVSFALEKPPPWVSAPGSPKATRDEVHVWRFDVPNEVDDELWRSVLSPEEVKRAEGLKVPRVRAAFVFGRATLRDVLARYIDCESTAFRFAYGPLGKPTLRDRALEFNVSHTDETLLIAVSHNRAVGIDVESKRAGLPFEAVAALFLPQADRSHLTSGSRGDREALFLQAWTRFEAQAKATGLGLAATASGGRGHAGDWHVRDIPLMRHAAAVCASGHDWNLALWVGDV